MSGWWPWCCCDRPCEGHQGETVAGIVTTEEFKDGCLVLIGDSANFIGGNVIDATDNEDFFTGVFSRVNGSVLCLGSPSDWPVEAGSSFQPTGTYIPGTTDIDTVGLIYFGRPSAASAAIQTFSTFGTHVEDVLKPWLCSGGILVACSEWAGGGAGTSEINANLTRLGAASSFEAANVGGSTGGCDIGAGVGAPLDFNSSHSWLAGLPDGRSCASSIAHGEEWVYRSSDGPWA